MKKTITFISLLFFLSSCASPASERVATAVPTQTQALIPTATATPQPELTVVDEKAEISAIYDENGDPTYVLQDDVWVAAELNAHGLLQARASDNRIVFWNFESREWEPAIGMSDMDLTEMYGDGNYRYNPGTGALEIRDSKGKWSEAIAVNQNGTLLIHIETGDLNADREALGPTEINIVGTRIIMTVEAPGRGPVDKLMYLKEAGYFVEPLTVSFKQGHWENFEEGTLEDYTSGRWAYSMGLQIPEKIKNAKPMAMHWNPEGWGSGITFQFNYKFFRGDITPGSSEDGAAIIDTRKITNPETGKYFPVDGMVVKLGEGGPYFTIPRNRDGFWMLSSAGNGHTDLEYGILDKPDSIGAKDGILLFTSGSCDVYEYYPGSSSSSQVAACELAGNDSITITAASGEPLEIWVLDNSWVDEDLVRKIRDLTNIEHSPENPFPWKEQIILDARMLEILAKLQLLPVPVF